MYVDAGSRYEDRYGLIGCSHLTDKLAYKSTKNYSGAEIMEKLNLLGGNFMCASSRESLIYQASVFNSDVENMFRLMSDTVARPLLTDEEVQEQKINAQYELGEIWLQSDLILPELFQQVAYDGKNLGSPLLCPTENLGDIDRNKLLRYRELFYQPSRLVVGLCGVPIAKAEELTLKYFEGFEASKNAEQIVKDKAVYTGGEKSLEVPKELAYKGQEFHHIYVGYEGVPIGSDEVYKLATLQMLIGGGVSFSAGGPGKGMYARAYTRILNQYGFVESCKSFIHNFTDSGLFGISLSCIPQADKVMADLIGYELALLMDHDVGKGGISDNEVSRAKNQLKSSLMMNLESKMVQLEDMGRQIQVFGKKVDVQEMCSKIDSVTRSDLIEVAKKILTGSEPTIVVQGDRASFGDIKDTLKKHGLGLNGVKEQSSKKKSHGWF
ncbi:DEKNAAC100405 [Brettanomyces naardenensis]|uniref:DEKNAAC100405 n=1 Tax=Brettanomyces naardenensis TaxID=13370 RepID=A0A448YEP7_BRENA|nr:DEKNAAC100405 [Brettanomyces naardenensis]